MKIGTVTGAVRPVHPADGLARRALLVVATQDGDIVAADLAGAKSGDRVLLTTGAAALRLSMEAPLDAAVVAVLE